MLRFMQFLICWSLLVSCVFTMSDARPQANSIAESPSQDLENPEADLEEVRSAYYDLPSQQIYPSIPMDRLQMLIAQYRPTNAYLRSPAWNNLNGMYRMPEMKRQARYRQCYFNPISCFKK